MANDAREIYEAVLGEIKKELSELVPQYEERIVHSLSKRMETVISDMTVQYDSRIGALEKKNNELEKRLFSIMQDQATSIDKRKNASTIEKNASSAKVDMSRWDIQRGYKFNGWIYYANEEMGEFLYKVRTDGTDKQQLTDYSIDGGFRVKNNKLYFDDQDFEEHFIDL